MQGRCVVYHWADGQWVTEKSLRVQKFSLFSKILVCLQVFVKFSISLKQLEGERERKRERVNKWINKLSFLL